MTKGIRIGLSSESKLSRNGWNIDPTIYGHCIAGWSAVPDGMSIKEDGSPAADSDSVAQILSYLPLVSSLRQEFSDYRPTLEIQAADGLPNYKAKFVAAESDFLLIPGNVFRGKEILTLVLTYTLNVSDVNAQTVFAAYDDLGNIVLSLGQEATTKKWRVRGRDTNGHSFDIVSSAVDEGGIHTLVIELDYPNGTLNVEHKNLGLLIDGVSLGTDSAIPDVEPSPSNILGGLDNGSSENFNGRFYGLFVYDEKLSSYNKEALLDAINFYIWTN